MATPATTTATTTTTTTNPTDENPLETLDSTSPKPLSDPTPTDTDADAEKSKDTPTPEPETDAPLSDVQKKMRRAERFGITVQLSEKEKRNSRAERYNPFHNLVCFVFQTNLLKLGFVFISGLALLLYYKDLKDQKQKI
jgi:hypothetical protein